MKREEVLSRSDLGTCENDGQDQQLLGSVHEFTERPTGESSIALAPLIDVHAGET